MGTQLPKQEGLDTGDPLVARPRPGEQVVTHLDFPIAEQIPEIETGVRELPERSLDDAAGCVRPEADDDGSERSRGEQSESMRLNMGSAF